MSKVIKSNYELWLFPISSAYTESLNHRTILVRGKNEMDARANATTHINPTWDVLGKGRKQCQK